MSMSRIKDLMKLAKAADRQADARGCEVALKGLVHAIAALTDAAADGNPENISGSDLEAWRAAFDGYQRVSGCVEFDQDVRDAVRGCIKKLEELRF